MMARLLSESAVLMQNMGTKSSMGKVFERLGYDKDPLSDRESFFLSDKKPGNWFSIKRKINGIDKHIVFFSYSRRYMTEDEINDRIAVLCPTDEYVGYRCIYFFGFPVPLNDEEGIKKMSAFTRNVMKRISRISSVESIFSFLKSTSKKYELFDWSRGE